MSMWIILRIGCMIFWRIAKFQILYHMELYLKKEVRETNNQAELKFQFNLFSDLSLIDQHAVNGDW